MKSCREAAGLRHMLCGSEIVGMTDPKPECGDVLSEPRETATDPVGVCLGVAFSYSGPAEKSSLPDKGGITFTPAAGLQLLARKRSGKLWQDSQPCRSTHGPPQTVLCLQRQHLGADSVLTGGVLQQLPAPRQHRPTGTPAHAGLFRA